MKKVIIIDDDDTLCTLLGEMVEILGYEAYIADSLKQAKEIFNQHHDEINLAIIDMNLDDATGDEVLIAMKEINSEFIAVLATGMSSELDEKELLDLGFSEIINKPYSMDKIHSLLNEHL